MDSALRRILAEAEKSQHGKAKDVFSGSQGTNGLGLSRCGPRAAIAVGRNGLLMIDTAGKATAVYAAPWAADLCIWPCWPAPSDILAAPLPETPLGALRVPGGGVLDCNGAR